MRRTMTNCAPSAEQVELQAFFFRGMGDPLRLCIIEHLLSGEKNVAALVGLVGSPQGRVSSHLAYLKWCGLLASQRRGRNVYYSVVDERVGEILSLAHGVLTRRVRHMASLVGGE